MPKKIPREPQDNLKSVVLIDEGLYKTDLGHKIFEKLKDEYMESGNIKVGVKQLPIPHSIQWIIPKRNAEGEKISKQWKTAAHTLVFESATKFSEILKKSTTPQEFMKEMFGADFERLSKTNKIRLLVHEETLDGHGKKSRTKMSADERHFIEELKRMQGAKNFETIVGCEILHGIDFVFVAPSTAETNECAVQVIRSTKSILDCLATAHSPSMYTSVDGKTTWYPPPAKKIGNTVAVAKNNGHLGLHLVWQKSLLQISKGMGIEQAKVITSNPDFASPASTIKTLLGATSEKEGEKILTNVQVRPSASSKDFMSLSARSSVGAEISKKFYHMMTTEEGNLLI